MIEYIDTHCHLSDEAFRGEEDRVIRASREAGVVTMLQADTDSSERDAMYRLCAAHSDCLKPMLGLYPGSVRENYREEMDKVYGHVGMGEVAIGEVGLDYHGGTDFKEQQKEVLEAQMQLAAKLDLPLNIHLRDATQDFLDVLKANAGLGLRGNMHAFSLNAQVFKQICRYGDWYAGIGGVLTFRKASIATEIAGIPLERIVLETDAPYLAPTPFRGTRNSSANIPVIAEFLATLKGISIVECAQVTTSNAKQLFGI